MNYLPINIDLSKKQVLVLGAGNVAIRKINMLLKTEVCVTCLSLAFKPEVVTLAKHNNLHLRQVDLETQAKEYLTAEFLGQFKLIISATDNAFIAQRAFKIAESNNLLINTVDEQELCNYITPAIVNRSPVMVAITSGGTAPVLARNIREKIEKLLPPNLGSLASKAGSIRHKVSMSCQSFLGRKHFWERFFSSTYARDILHHNSDFDDDSMIKNIQSQSTSLGEVALVGAGPGDPDLLTIKALRLIQQADVVFHDRLVSKEVLELVRKDAEMISVGKAKNHHSVPQEQINQLLVTHAKAGKLVVRLKGGDPFVFGRGGEELETLKEQQIKFQIVPGITAAVGCSAYSGIPLTHRDYAQSVVFITAHCKHSIDTLNWPSLARDRQTLAVYMGLIKATFLSAQLIKHGKNKHTPFSIIANGTTAKQQVVNGKLYQLDEVIKYHNIQSPAMIIIGEVAAFSDKLAWFNTSSKDPQTFYSTLEKTA